jgi:hypothetical protein
MIYGYDDIKKVFNVYAYNGIKLSEFEISYEEYTAAYNSQYKIDRFHSTILYRKKEDEYKIDLQKIKWYLLDYIDGINTHDRVNLHEVKHYKPQFGINIYDELIYMFGFQRNLKLQINLPDLYCFYEHKKLMLNRLIYLSNHSDIKCSDSILDEFKDIENKCAKIFLLSMKINRKNFESKNDFDTLIEIIKIVREKEKIAYNKFLKFNKSVLNNF